jgi:germination protein M
MPTIRPRSVLRSSALVVVSLTLAACASSGGLGPVPSTPTTPQPSLESNPPDVTPAPSTPSATAVASGSPGTSSSPPASSGPTASASVPVETMVIRAYYLLSAKDADGLVPTLRVVPKTTGVARAAMEALLDAASIHRAYPQIDTAIPDGTTLLGISIKDGVATVDLSREFGQAGSGAYRARLGEVVYTLTQFSTVRAVAFQVEGQTLTSFGPEGIVIDGPLARKDFESLLPSIFVDRPAFAAAAPSPVRVRGNANVFEATFRVAILDGAGKQLVDQQAMATCGTGCRGTFDTTVRYTVSKAQWGILRVYFGSAVDGSPQDVRDYPVWLTPAS